MNILVANFLHRSLIISLQKLPEKKIWSHPFNFSLTKTVMIYRAEVIREGKKQDGRVEGRALTPSCENTRITTGCWTIIDRKTLELTKKDTPYPKTKEKPQ